MPVKLTGFVFATAIAWAAVPAWGAGMPDYGTKNFSPGGATPSYFTNEKSAALGIPENESADDGADLPTQSAQTITEPRQSDEAVGRHRGKFANRRPQAHAAAHSRVNGHTPRATGARNARTASTERFAGTRQSGHSKSARTNLRHASAKTPSRKG
jgi:hypothetical protein